jgi:hypothetical protein
LNTFLLLLRNPIRRQTRFSAPPTGSKLGPPDFDRVNLNDFHSSTMLELKSWLSHK